MPPFPKPKFTYSYSLSGEVGAARAHKHARGIPVKASNRLLIATWNIANLGVQQRTDDDKKLISEILGWFDVVAVEEINDNYGDFADRSATS